MNATLSILRSFGTSPIYCKQTCGQAGSIDRAMIMQSIYFDQLTALHMINVGSVFFVVGKEVQSQLLEAHNCRMANDISREVICRGLFRESGTKAVDNVDQVPSGSDLAQRSQSGIMQKLAPRAVPISRHSRGGRDSIVCNIVSTLQPYWERGWKAVATLFYIFRSIEVTVTSEIGGRYNNDGCYRLAPVNGEL